MPADIVTKSIAQLGLVTGTIVLADGPDGNVTATVPGASLPFSDPEAPEGASFIEYMPKAEMYHTADCIAEALADASISMPEACAAFAAQAGAAGTCGYVLLRPPKGQCPDGASAILPWLGSQDPVAPSIRCFPSLPMLDAVSMAYPEGQAVRPEVLDAWCAENQEQLLMAPGPSDSILYHGWNRSTGRRCCVRAEKIDFTKPWRVIAMPDGSEDAVPAQPMLLADRIMNCYEPA